MKLEIGKKYVPHSKSDGWGKLEDSPSWVRAQKTGQNYLYYTGVYDDDHHCFDNIFCPAVGASGDFFKTYDVTEYIENIKTDNMKQTFVVDEKFILEAYDAACSEWKEKIKSKFPVLFYKSPIEEAIEKVGTKVYGYPVTFEGNLVKILLPNANREWSLDVFEYVQNFIKRYPSSYPRHDKHLKTDEFMYIDFNN
jgi:hypothetical protein